MRTNRKGLVVVTGGVRGIGRAVSLGLLKNNYDVVALYKQNDQAASNLQTEASNYAGELSIKKVSVDDYASVNQCIMEIENNLGEITGLVNNAGITKDGYLMLMSETDWLSVVNTNLRGVLYCTHAILPYMKTRRNGVIISMSSVAGHIGISGQTNYSATKSAIIGFTHALAAEVADSGIHVYALAPGYIRTEMIETIPPKMMQTFLNAIPMKRIGEADEISTSIISLLEHDFSYSTGQTFLLDGGACIV